MKQWLVNFDYEYYCQGWEYTNTHRLVEAISFEAACEVLKAEFQNAENFRNYTI